MAFGVAKSASGKAEETTRLFTAKAKTTSPVAVVDFDVKIVDGTNFDDPTVHDKAGVGFQFSPNAATVKYAYGVYRESILEYPDSDIAAILTGDPASMIDPRTDPDDNFRGYYIFEWGERAVVITVGINAIGEVGSLQKQLIEVKSDGQGGGGRPRSSAVTHPWASITEWSMAASWIRNMRAIRRWFFSSNPIRSAWITVGWIS